MIVNYIYNIFKFKKWKILLLIASCTFLLKMNVIQNIYPSVMQLAALHKCPACYGVSACHKIHEVDISWNDIHTLSSYLFGVKNVFFGTYNGSKVVLKKLAHSSELRAFDATFCDKFHLEYPCSNISAEILNKHAVDFYELIKKIITSEFSNDDSSRLRLCPTTEHLNDLFYNIHRKNQHIDSTQYLINLWTLVSINPEPLILQILPAEDGWPVPKYFGACGQIVIEEYIGLPFIAYYEKPWIQRIKIASSLLNAAYMFTFHNEKFAFYLTDVSAYNVAIDHNNVAKFIDLENIIIVDKNISTKDRPKRWQELHENIMHLECSNCFAFSPQDICDHHLSDHNYYAICQLLLDSENETSFHHFLHDIPMNIQHPNIEYLLKQCAVPNFNNTRIIFGQRLKASLDIIYKNYLETPT